MIAQELCAPLAHSPYSPNSPDSPDSPDSPNQLPTTTALLSIYFGHISATFPTIFPVFCSIEQRKCISRYHGVSSSICESLRGTSSSATFQHMGNPLKCDTVRRYSVANTPAIRYDVVSNLGRQYTWEPPAIRYGGLKFHR